MHSSWPIKGIKHAVNGLGSQRAVLGASGNICFIHLQAGTGATLNLLGKDISYCQGKLLKVPIVQVEQGAGEHIGAGHGKLEDTAGHGRGTGAILNEVECPTV